MSSASPPPTAMPQPSAYRTVEREQAAHGAERTAVRAGIIVVTPTFPVGRGSPCADQVLQAGEAARAARPGRPGVSANTSLDSTRPSTPLTSRTEVTMRWSRPPVWIVVAPLDEDDEVDGARDQHLAGLDGQPFGGLQRVRGDTVEDLAGAVGVDRGQRAVVALRHRVQHGHDLVAEDLADDDAGGVHTQRPAYQLGHRDHRPGPRSWAAAPRRRRRSGAVRRTGRGRAPGRARR